MGEVFKEVTLPSWLNNDLATAPAPSARPARRGFLERNLRNFSRLLRVYAATGEPVPAKGGLKSLNPAARTAGVFLLILSASATGSAPFLCVLLFLTAVLALLTGSDLRRLALRALPALVLSSVIFMPLIFNALSPGETLVPVGFEPLSITKEGLGAASFMVLRVAVIALLAGLLLLSTRTTDLFSALSRLKVPAFFVTLLFMTYRYLSILVTVAEDATLARRSRTITDKRLKDGRRWFASGASLIVKKSLKTAEEVAMAMESRGFSGRTAPRAPERLKPLDYLWIGLSSFFLFASFGS